MRRMLFGWYRVVLPGWTAPAFLVVYLISVAPRLLVRYFWGFDAAADLNGTEGILVLCAGAYGVYRVAAFHPAIRPKYWRWLWLTPWTADKPLPLGPVRLVWQDLVVIGVLSAVMSGPQIDRRTVCLAFMLTYLAALAVSFHKVGMRVAGYAILFGLGLIVRLWEAPWAAIGVAVIIYAVARIALPRSLAMMRSTYVSIKVKKIPSHMRFDQDDPYYGWPFQVLHPQPGEPNARVDKVLFPLLVGWLSYAAFALDPTDEAARTLGFLLSLPIIAFGPLVRFGLYCSYYRSPISLPGRIATFKLIVPGYDKALIAPLAVFLIGFRSMYWLRDMHGPMTICLPALYILALLALFNAPPSFERWRLTGQHRIRAANQRVGEVIKL